MTKSGPPWRGRRASAGLAVLDHEGRIIRSNKAFHALVQPVGPLMGAAAETLFAAAQRGPAKATIRATLTDRKSRLFTTCAAEPLVVIIRFVPRLRQGRLTRFLLRAEAAGSWPGPNKRPPRDEVRLLDGRLATVIHDFNNLLGVIAASAKSGRERAAHDPVLLQDLDVISTAAGRGAALMRKLVASDGRGDGEGAPMPQAPGVAVNLNAAVEALSPLLRRILDAQIALDMVAGAPPLAWLDPVGLDQAILNLAMNARDAMAGSGRLTLSTGHLDSYATLEVADTGEGISPNLLPRVLRPGVTTKRARGGQGLGLASVFEIVQQARGSLVIESASGEGTVVRLHFPAARMPMTGHLVLLVEDEAPVRSIAARALARHGWDVLPAESVASALAAAEPRLADIALVLADFSLPDGDGLALIHALRARRPGLPAVLTSGYPASVLAQGERELRILAKPYDLVSLVRTCAEAVGEAGGETVGMS